MATNITIDTEFFPDDCDMSGDGKHWAIDFNIGAPIFQKVYIDNPGVAGLITKRGNYRKRPIIITTMWFGLDKSDLLTTIKSFVDTLSNVAFQVIIGQDEFQECELVNEETKWEVPKPVITPLQAGAAYLCTVVFSFISKSDSDIAQ